MYTFLKSNLLADTSTWSKVSWSACYIKKTELVAMYGRAHVIRSAKNISLTKFKTQMTPHVRVNSMSTKICTRTVITEPSKSTITTFFAIGIPASGLALSLDTRNRFLDTVSPSNTGAAGKVSSCRWELITCRISTLLAT